MKYMIPLSLIFCCIFMISCGDEKAPEKEPVAPSSEFSALKHLSLNAKPENVQTISALKKSEIKAGEQVTLQGRIGGSGNPFVTDYAAFMLADDTILAACDISDDDHCAKPWDYCCEDKSKIKSNIITVQAVDDNGKVIKSKIDGLDGIKAGSFVVVSGAIAEGSNQDNLIVNISGLYHDSSRKIKKSHDHKHDHDHKH